MVQETGEGCRDPRRFSAFLSCSGKTQLFHFVPLQHWGRLGPSPLPALLAPLLQHCGTRHMRAIWVFWGPQDATEVPGHCGRVGSPPSVPGDVAAALGIIQAPPRVPPTPTCVSDVGPQHFVTLGLENRADKSWLRHRAGTSPLLLPFHFPARTLQSLQGQSSCSAKGSLGTQLLPASPMGSGCCIIREY